MDENVTEFEAGNDEEYEVKGNRDSAVYAKESAAGHLPRLYYLIFWKGYPEEKSTWEPTLAVQYLRKLLSAFHKDNPNKPTATSLPADTAPPMAQTLVAPLAKAAKQKFSQQATSIRNKKAKT